MKREVFDAAVIGAGASGALVAAHAPASKRLALIDAGARAARGLAYGTPYGAHLLNVPAARMSAFQDDPEHFLRWLRARDPSADGFTFAPRKLYGDYLHDVLSEANVIRVAGTAIGLTRRDNEWVIHLHDDRTLHSRTVILALGNLPPADPFRMTEDVPAGYLRDPWAPGATAGLDPNADVLLIGTGLTMIDVALALRDEGHRGAIHAISRHGRLPAAHSRTPVAAATLDPPAGMSPRQALRWLRGQITADWRPVIDGLRPHTARIWTSWTIAQRASFLRHLRNIWDVHRHRMAPQVADEVADLIRVHRGRVSLLESSGDSVIVHCEPELTLKVARVINCTGPATDYARLDMPLVAHMRRSGWLVADPLRLGIEADADGRILGRDGKPVPGLFTLGPLRRPALWESTAIPEIRAQAAALAELLSPEP